MKFPADRPRSISGMVRHGWREITRIIPSSFEPQTSLNHSLVAEIIRRCNSRSAALPSCSCSCFCSRLGQSKIRSKIKSKSKRRIWISACFQKRTIAGLVSSQRWPWLRACRLIFFRSGRIAFSLLPFVAAAFLLLALIGCARNGPTADLVIINGPEPESLDPAIQTGQADGRAVMSIFEGLTRYNPTNATPLPGLAERWEQSTDGLVYTFFLRTNAVLSLIHI